MANVDIAVLNTKTYSDTLEIAAQKTRSAFRQGSVEIGCTGEGHRPISFIGKTVVRERTTRGAQKTIADTNHTGRWISRTAYISDSEIIDDMDKRLTALDPTSGYHKNQMAAMWRKFDDDFIAKLHGDALTGKDGTSTTSFPGANTVTSTDGFIIADLLDALQLLQENEVILDMNDPEELYLAMKPAHFREFVKMNEVSNKDYGNSFYDGQTYQVGSWMGINIIVDNHLLGAVGVTEMALWAKSGMYTGIWEDVHGTVTQDDGKEGEPMLCTMYGDFGMTRVEEEKVIKIITDERTKA